MGGIRLAGESVKEVVTRTRVAERHGRIDVEDESEQGTDVDLCVAELDEVSVGGLVVEKVALVEDLEEAVSGREALGVLEEDGEAVDGGVDELVVELGVSGIKDAEVVSGKDVEVGLDWRDLDVGMVDVDGERGRHVLGCLLVGVVDVGDGVLAGVEGGGFPEAGVLGCLGVDAFGAGVATETGTVQVLG